MYIWLAIFAYFLFALNGVADKFLLTKAVRHPIAYAFYIGVMSPFVWLLAPFGLKAVSFPDLLVAIVGGASFIVASYFLYIAIQKTSIDRILPLEGGLVPIFTLLLAYIILGERLTDMQLAAFVFLVFGAVLISLKKDRTGWHPKALGSGLAAAALYALSFVLTKYIFDQTNFVSGLIWTRLGFSVVCLLFLIPKKSRGYIFAAPRETSSGNKLLYYGARLAGGSAGLLQNYAISLGSVIIVNALQGSQFVILIAMTTFLSRYYPKILKERYGIAFLAQKIAAIVIISFGLYYLTR